MESKKTNETLMLKAKVLEEGTLRKLHVMWIGMYFMKNIIKDWEGLDVIVCGKLTYEDTYNSFHMNNPIIFSTDIKNNLKVYPVYTKMSGISEEWMEKAIAKSLEIKIEDTLPEELRKRFHLMSKSEAVASMHSPRNMTQIENAKKRPVFESLYDFAYSIEERNTSVSKGSVYNIKSTELVKAYVSMLPFALTESQKKAFSEMKSLAADGRRVNALIQGDVGSGKTALAFLMMFAMAGSGYQAALMAPTEILARQHYEELKKYADRLGVTCAFLSGSLKAKEKKALHEQIKNGDISLIVGTHSVASESVEYKDLALAIVDEEHRFGTGVEERLFSMSEKGMHTIVMSATPIPRTISDAIYGDSMLVYDLERPAGRQEVQTRIYNKDSGIYKHIENEIAKGRQAYVICPLVEKTESSEKNAVLSVEETEKEYKKYFDEKGITVASVTGKTSTKEAEKILEDFSKGDIKILIATTVIEVGVNVPNASTIVINNAERFGMAQLHQLRGRVGRGGYEGYCILKSADIDNERLKLVVSSTNGFELAEEDAKLRGPGDILGERQSGSNKMLELVLQFPNMYKIAKEEAKKSMNNII